MHHDEKLFIKTGKFKISRLGIFMASFDWIIAIFFIIFLYLKFPTNLVLIGIFSSLLWDILKAGYITPLKNNKFFMWQLKTHAKIQKHTSCLIGLLIQINIILILLKILL